MPALLFMGRRWSVGGDEFALPSLCSIALRMVWSIALVVILCEVGGDLRGCADGWLVYTYMVCSLTTFTLAVLVEWRITRVSIRGSIADTEPRASLSLYLELHMLLGIVQLIMAALGVVLLTYFDHTCDGLFSDEALNILLAALVVSQIVDVSVTCCCCVLMRGSPHEMIPDDLNDENHALYERFASTEIEGQWESRCHWLYRVMVILTCGVFGGQGSSRSDFEQLARVMARIFHTEEYLDVVPSDIAAGIVLLYHKQRNRWHSGDDDSAKATPTATARESSRAKNLDGPEHADRELDWAVDGLELGMGAVAEESLGSVNRRPASSAIEEEDAGVASRCVPDSVLRRSLDHPKFYRVERRNLLDVRTPVDRQALEELAYFSRYSLAIYTWYLFIYDRPCCGACDLLCYSFTRRPHAFHKARDMQAEHLFESRHLDSVGASRDGDSGPDSNRRAMETDTRASNEGGIQSGDDGAGALGRRRVRVDTSETPRTGHTSSEGSNQMTAVKVWRSRRLSRRTRRASGLGSNGEAYVSIRGDNWLGTHEAGLLRVAGLHPNCEVVDAQFHDDIMATPYCVLVDHEKKCVVVAIRGTMSLDDCLCDLQAEPVSMAESGRRWGFDGTDMFAHQGVLARAEWLRQDLENEGHLHALMRPGDDSDWSSRSKPTEDSGRDTSTSASSRGVERIGPGSQRSSKHLRCRGYDLRITGHSLGGSTGVLLTYMLRRDYPSVRCISISPMGGLLNSPHAEDCGEFVLSGVMGDDVIPRLSVASMEHMRDEVLDLIARSKVNKMTVMRSIMKVLPVSWAAFWGARDRARSAELSAEGDLRDLVYPEDEEVPRTGYSHQLRRYREWVDRKRRESCAPELLPAGRFVHYVKTANVSSCCRSRRLYTPVWATPSDFTKIAVSQRMFVDHILTTTCTRFSETLKDLLKESKETEQGSAQARSG